MYFLAASIGDVSSQQYHSSGMSEIRDYLYRDMPLPQSLIQLYRENPSH